jgi:hypothetical protein
MESIHVLKKMIRLKYVSYLDKARAIVLNSVAVMASILET